METRKDGWDIDADIYLAETVLKHIEAGSTQLKAFEEAGVKLKRTSAACGFRWNGALRKQYEKSIEKAKKVRIKNKNSGNIVSINDSKTQLTEVPQETRAKDSLVEKSTQANEATIPFQLDQEFVHAFNDAMDQVSNNIMILRQITLDLAGRLQTANELNLKLQSEYSNLQNEIINAVDMKVFLKIAGNLESEQITG
ncbi:MULTISPECIES: hypothetical protein [Paenibacillus]|uniref:hypothetical protein n=1 Tax=Paenibacillus TaxID=44249 RepID=UPI0009A583BB|nr:MULTISPECIES: hypothetical protein [Paenibacillus]MCZ1267695.1 hypothetical protein [Paenibacillus tundrae]SLK16116.1 transcription factor, RsfA family [Paenibacillus sp. RU5A]SOC74212.1 transcription factor, RsfA family [Paenibacillus sp. RU26A]SOC76362.1 transcription factor, RsfA family [Paenibacillus sp. RU5M]